MVRKRWEIGRRDRREEPSPERKRREGLGPSWLDLKTEEGGLKPRHTAAWKLGMALHSQPARKQGTEF